MTKVFVLSLHRCATQSTGLFMQNAGMQRCHWPAVVDGIDYEAKIFGVEGDTAKIADILAPVFDRFDVVDDVPVPVLYKELAARYPDAKFVAVYRNPFDWVRSVRIHCQARFLHLYERAQYWHYLDNRPVSLEGITDSALIGMFLRHHQELLAYFGDRGNFLLVDLGDPDIGQRIASFVGFPNAAFPKFDYKAIEAAPS